MKDQTDFMTFYSSPRCPLWRILYWFLYFVRCLFAACSSFSFSILHMILRNSLRGIKSTLIDCWHEGVLQAWRCPSSPWRTHTLHFRYETFHLCPVSRAEKQQYRISNSWAAPVLRAWKPQEAEAIPKWTLTPMQTKTLTTQFSGELFQQSTIRALGVVQADLWGQSRTPCPPTDIENEKARFGNVTSLTLFSVAIVQGQISAIYQCNIPALE